MSAERNEIQPEYSPKGTGKARLLTLDSLDRRTAAAQSALALRDKLVAERGGEARLSALELALCESAACLSALVTDHLARWMRGQPVDLATLTAAVNARRREAELIGIRPELVDVTPPGTVGREIIDLSKLTDEELAAYHLLASKAAEQQGGPIFHLPDNGRGDARHANITAIQRVIIDPDDERSLKAAAAAYERTLKPEADQ